MATVYLSPSGSDSYTYAQAQNPATPWATLSKVQASATSGDTVMMAAGTYTMQDITFSKSFNIYGAGRTQTIIVGDENVHSWLFNTTGTTMKLFDIGFSQIKTGHYSNASLLRATAVSVNLEVYRCRFADFRMADSDTATFLNFTALTVAACEFKITQDRMISLVLYSGPPTNFVCQFVFNSIYVSDYTASWSIVYYYASSSIFGNFIIKNNIVNNGSGKTIYLFKSPSGSYTHSISNNCLYNVLPGDQANQNGITSDPQMIDPVNGYFDLRPNSPCRGAGIVM